MFAGVGMDAAQALLVCASVCAGGLERRISDWAA